MEKVSKGQRVTITCQGLTVTGTVISADHETRYHQCQSEITGFLIEIQTDEGHVHYWKSKIDGGSIIIHYDVQVIEVRMRKSDNDGWMELPVQEYVCKNTEEAVLFTRILFLSTPPVAAFVFSYKNFGVGPGNQCLIFDVKNTGSVIWESFRLEARNITQGVGGTITRDEFTNFDQWCASTGGPASLSSGSSGTAYAMISMPANPSGNSATAILTLMFPKWAGRSMPDSDHQF